jgi:hypothetical protein
MGFRFMRQASFDETDRYFLRHAHGNGKAQNPSGGSGFFCTPPPTAARPPQMKISVSYKIGNY